MIQRALQSVQVTKVPASAEQLQADAARAKDYSRKKVRPAAALREAGCAFASNVSLGPADGATPRAAG